ncbi:hypothetical protein OF83DRAFT_1167810 [Amylostereum chailletii]|nr:hypothetical protein OF83DRAFT_1167810 [Amylostereum chailletii]
MPTYHEGEHVEYKPVHLKEGPAGHSTGEITDVRVKDGHQKMTILNDNTGNLETNYGERNIISKIDDGKNKGSDAQK